VSGFAGVPLAGADFFAELRFNNDKAWWAANKARWERDVRTPLAALCEALAPEFGDAKLFRPFRDVRFSNDKSPYKDHQGGVVRTVDGVGYYLQLSADGLLTGGGWYEATPDLVARYRAAVDADASGQALARIVDDLVGRGFGLHGDTLKTAPRGFTADHPRAALLRRKGLSGTMAHGTPDWLATPEALDRVRDDWRAYGPLMEWCATHLG